ncbi:hypothetical protein D6D01_01702 [Aureobasidium pullulans]|uniref:Uncharacterized protein n=1 Tax=Aureobasidium pullulans TaxID=5580 RepID=A0A4S9LY92_AURPU|nr:hypothetical protein D6D01_01702 [Aureobasidium pullulans]
MRAAGPELSILLSNCRFLIGLSSSLSPYPILLYTSRLLSGCAKVACRQPYSQSRFACVQPQTAELRWMVGARSRDCVTRRRPSMVNVLGFIDSLFLSSQKVKSRFLAHNMTLLNFSRPGFSSGD